LEIETLVVVSFEFITEVQLTALTAKTEAAAVHHNPGVGGNGHRSFRSLPVAA